MLFILIKDQLLGSIFFVLEHQSKQVFAHLTMKVDIAAFIMTKVVFPWLEEDDSSVHAEAFKWRVSANASYECYMKQLSCTELQCVLPHCKTFVNKVMNTVQQAAHQGPSLFLNFPRTLSTTLQSVWHQVLANHPVAPMMPDTFNVTIHCFIAFHFDPEDQHELLQQLRAPKKPQNISVLTFWYAGRHLNGYVALLPGNGVPLDEATEHQAMFDCQPNKRQDDFTQHKGFLTDFDLEVVMHYFCNHRKIALHSEEENQKHQKLDAESKKHSGNGNHANGNHPCNGGGSAGKRSKHNPNAPCHEHPRSGHLWKDCFKNPDNLEGDEAKARAKAAKAAAAKGGKKSDGHVAEVVANAVLDDGHVAEVSITDSNVVRIPLSTSVMRNWKPSSMRRLLLNSLMEP
jgi:hypothetical protein